MDSWNAKGRTALDIASVTARCPTFVCNIFSPINFQPIARDTCVFVPSLLWHSADCDVSTPLVGSRCCAATRWRRSHSLLPDIAKGRGPRLFDPEDGNSSILRNVGSHSPKRHGVTWHKSWNRLQYRWENLRCLPASPVVACGHPNGGILIDLPLGYVRIHQCLNSLISQTWQNTQNYCEIGCACSMRMNHGWGWVQNFPAWHTKAAPNGKCCEGYIAPSMMRLMYQYQYMLK